MSYLVPPSAETGNRIAALLPKFSAFPQVSLEELCRAENLPLDYAKECLGLAGCVQCVDCEKYTLQDEARLNRFHGWMCDECYEDDDEDYV